MSSIRHPKLIAMGTLCVVALGATIAVAMASGTTINPAGDELLVSSTDVSFTIGTATVYCSVGQTSGSIPSPAVSSMSLSDPIFQDSGGKECESTGIGGALFKVRTVGKWELVANSSTSASLKFGVEGILMYVAKCPTIWVKPATTITGVWTNGTAHTPVAEPSTLTFSAASIPLTEITGAECPLSGATSMALSAHFVVNDTTHLTEPVTLK
jgi:hypothetical protein